MLCPGGSEPGPTAPPRSWGPSPRAGGAPPPPQQGKAPSWIDCPHTHGNPLHAPLRRGCFRPPEPLMPTLQARVLQGRSDRLELGPVPTRSGTWSLSDVSQTLIYGPESTWPVFRWGCPPLSPTGHLPRPGVSEMRGQTRGSVWGGGRSQGSKQNEHQAEKFLPRDARPPGRQVCSLWPRQYQPRYLLHSKGPRS